jgi:hypothetical protein
MRTALEEILSERGIPRTTINAKRKRIPIPLQQRIDKYAKIDSDAAQYLEALKWLGNIGSHAARKPPSLKDLLEGFDVFEHAIEHIYVKRAKAVKKIAKRMVQRKGKPKTR